MKKKKMRGFIQYDDPANGFSFDTSKLSDLVINGNQVQFTGVIKLGHHQKITVTIDVVDNGDPGTLDTFSIMGTNGYSASGHLTSGNIRLH
jgi:hypothetical protein